MEWVYEYYLYPEMVVFFFWFDENYDPAIMFKTYERTEDPWLISVGLLK